MTTRGENEWNDYRITHKDPMTTRDEDEWNDYRMIITRPDEMTPRIILHYDIDATEDTTISGRPYELNCCANHVMCNFLFYLSFLLFPLVLYYVFSFFSSISLVYKLVLYMR